MAHKCEILDLNHSEFSSGYWPGYFTDAWQCVALFMAPGINLVTDDLMLAWLLYRCVATCGIIHGSRYTSCH